MTRVVEVGGLKIGGGNRVTIQSMTNSKTSNIENTKSQITQLQNAGCDIVRLAVSNDEDVLACKEYIKSSSAPLVADIQFDYKLAIKCSEIGFSKVRFNPGNIGSDDNVSKLVSCCKANNTAIRIGVNAGSLDKNLIGKFPSVADAMVESAMQHVRLLEKHSFYNTIVSVKSSNVKQMIQAYRQLSKICDYPLHLGVTESGADERGIIKSAIGLGALLVDGIGDTIRVSLSGDPVSEVIAAKKILQALKIDNNYCEIVSCPTCSRCNYDLYSMVKEVEKLTNNIVKPLKIAVMGCVVNGPGEAKDADFGIAGGDGKVVVFNKGQIVATVPTEEALATLSKLIDAYK